MKKNYQLKQIIFLFIVLLNLDVVAQPYYFYSEPISSDSSNIYKVDLNNGEKQLFLSNIRQPFNFTWDNYQAWFILYDKFDISFFRPESPTLINSILPGSNYELEVSSVIVKSKSLIYMSWPRDNIENWIFETFIFNSQTLSQIKISSVSINPLAFLSSDENFIYQPDADSVREKLITKYSIAMDSIIGVKYFSYIFTNNESPNFKDGKLGNALFAYNSIMSDINTKKYVVYNFENETFYPIISFPYRSYGYLSPNAEYVILQKALLDVSKPSRENINGEISVYKTSTGELVSNLTLPPEGKILIFDSYPDKFFYYVPETEEAITIDLTELLVAQVEPSVTFDPTTGNYNIRYMGEDSLVNVIFEPSTKIVPDVSTRVVSLIDSNYYIYYYTVNNGSSSIQRLRKFCIEILSEISQISNPDEYWKTGFYSFVPVFRWSNSKGSGGLAHPLNGIAPDSSKTGFAFVSVGLPTISHAYFSGNRTIPLAFPDEPPDEISELLTPLRKFPNNTVIKKTIGPKDPPDPFIHIEFIDTLNSYADSSYALGWIQD